MMANPPNLCVKQNAGFREHYLRDIAVDFRSIPVDVRGIAVDLRGIAVDFRGIAVDLL